MTDRKSHWSLWCQGENSVQLELKLDCLTDETNRPIENSILLAIGSYKVNESVLWDSLRSDLIRRFGLQSPSLDLLCKHPKSQRMTYMWANAANMVNLMMHGFNLLDNQAKKTNVGIFRVVVLKSPVILYVESHLIHFTSMPLPLLLWILLPLLSISNVVKI